jgi:hypothetical protein
MCSCSLSPQGMREGFEVKRIPDTDEREGLRGGKGVFVTPTPQRVPGQREVRFPKGSVIGLFRWGDGMAALGHRALPFV